MKNIGKSFLYYIKKPKKIIRFFAYRGFFNWMPDEQYLRMMYRINVGKKLNTECPKSFNEKLQWLKLNYRDPRLSMMVDKCEVKKYVSEIIGDNYIIPTIGVWDNYNDIDFSLLPNQFVLKCTHDSGGLVIVRDKQVLNQKNVRKKINKSLKRNYYYWGREWPYKNVKPRIIAEEFMCNSNETELVDYKLMCFDGKVKCIFTCTDRYSGNDLKVTFFDTNWNRLPFERHYHSDPTEIPPPHSLKLMISLAEKISFDLPFARIDFYEINKKPYFGEITFFPGNGMEEFNPESWDLELGNWISLPKQEG